MVTNKETHEFCLNCGARLTGPYCSACGQKDTPARLKLGPLIMSFVDSFTSFDSKFFKTVKYLVLRPGFLAMEYNAGRRERYYHPARAYVFLSFIYFLLYFTLPDNPYTQGWFQIYTGSKKQPTSYDYTSKKGGASIMMDSVDYRSLKQYDSIQKTLPPKQRDDLLGRLLTRKEIVYQQNHHGGESQFTADLAGNLVANFPKAIFFLLPVFAFILRLFYLRKNIYYSEHLVLSVTCYNFYYLIFSVTLLLEWITGFYWLQFIANLWLMGYFYMSMRRVYGQSAGWTILKFFSFGVLFSICAMAAMMINFAISVMLL